MKMTRRTVLLASGAALTAGCQQRPQAPRNKPALAPSTPEQTLEIFNAAIQKWDTAALARCVVLGEPFELQSPKPIRKGPVLELTPSKAVIEDGRATLTVTVRVLSNEDFSPLLQVMPLTETLAFEKEGEQWKIIASDQPNRGYLNYCATLSRYTAQASRKALELSCLSNLKQLGTALVMFLQDHQNQFALKPESYEAAIWEYVKNERLFHCPCSDQPTLRSYTFNAALAGLSPRQLLTPSKTVLLYEGTRLAMAFRHEKKAGIVFVDGRSKMVTEAEARTLVWRP